MVQRGPAHKRRLVAMMFTDIVSYSALSKARESMSIELLEEHRAILREVFPAYEGREVKTIGDAFFIEFPSVVAAVECAIELQATLHERNINRPESRQLSMRAGIHLGDVIENKNDFLGDHLNTASRIEGFAPPGGVCFTRQVFDQIQDNKIAFPIRRLGFRRIKNVEAKIELYRVVLPFESHRSRNPLRGIVEWGKRVLLLNDGSAARAREQAPLLALAFGAIAMLTTIGISTWNRMPAYYGAPSGERAPATFSRVELSQGWKVLIVNAGASVEKVLHTSEDQWVAYDPNKPWEYRDQFKGEYWLKKDFEATTAPEHPAAVLGLIRSSHELYLNGYFIGGSGHYSPVTWYAFDRKLLKPNNVLLIHGRTDRSMMPGFQILGGELGAFLGEFADVQSAVTRDVVHFHVPSAIYLTTTILAALFCFFSYLLVPDRGRLLYFLLYLLFSSLMLAYYNPLVISVLDDKQVRAIKALSLALSSAVLFSTYLHLTGRARMARINNWVTLGAAAVFIGASPFVPLFTIYNGSLGVSLAYSAVWVAWVTGATAANLSQRFQQKRLQASSDDAYGALVFVFGLLNLFLIASSFKAGSSLMPESFRIALRSLGMSYPFLFSVLVFAFTTIDYALKARAQKRAKARDQLILELVGLISNGTDFDSTIATIQKEVVQFVDAERSSLYLLSPGHSSRCVISSFVVGSPESQRVTRSLSSLNEGMMKEVLEGKQPLLIKDIAKDYRFSRYLKKGGNPADFRSGSCMLLPLVLGGEVLGILTVADKRGGEAFTTEDFGFLQTISKDLALLVSSHRMQKEIAATLSVRPAV